MGSPDGSAGLIVRKPTTVSGDPVTSSMCLVAASNPVIDGIALTTDLDRPKSIMRRFAGAGLEGVTFDTPVLLATRRSAPLGNPCFGSAIIPSLKTHVINKMR